MATLNAIALYLVVVCFVNVKAYREYQECRVYAEGEEKSDSVCRYCTRSFNFTDKNEYCREYECAPVECNAPVKRENDCCASCPGTCNYGGRIYNVGDSFHCLDGGNYCSCFGTGMISTTLMGVSPEITCNPRYYGACTLYKSWEQKDRYRQQSECITRNVSGSQVEVCKEYICARTFFACQPEDRVRNEDNNCYTCPGTCNYGGRIYNVKQSFTCIDGINNCRCVRTGKVVKTTRIQPSIDKMCKTYGDQCVVYSPSEERDTTKCRYCIGDYWAPWASYCREYTCAPTDCDEPIQSEYQCCASCPGTCNYGGKVYNVSDGFICLDGVNRCGCVSTGGIFSTLMAGPKEAACFSDFSWNSKK